MTSEKCGCSFVKIVGGYSITFCEEHRDYLHSKLNLIERPDNALNEDEIDKLKIPPAGSPERHSYVYGYNISISDIAKEYWLVKK